jgi:hypothetical protein
MDEPSILRLDRQSLPNPHILPPVPRVSLTITRGRVRERVRPIAGRVFLIGAASDCDLVLGDLQFPEAYAYVFVDGSDVSIRRLGSGPPLLLCGQPIEAGELFHGDLIELGPFELRVVIDQPPRRHGHDDDNLPHGSAPSRAEADRLVAIDEVRMLLADIRAAVGEQSAPLKLFAARAMASRAKNREATSVRASA